jgi:hypothetical protein
LSRGKSADATTLRMPGKQKTTLAAPRRFPPPWSVEDIGATFVVRDHSGQQLAYVYFD